MADSAGTVWRLDKYARYVLRKTGSSAGQWNMADSAGTVWRLDKYARYVLRKTGSSAGQWNQYSDSPEARLMLTLTDTKYLIVLQGSVVLESHSLATARAWMRGMCKNDSLLFMYKHGKGTRRFKVKFAQAGDQTGSEVCQQAATRLSTLFSVHLTTPQTPTPSGPLQHSTQNQDSSKGDTNTASAPLQGDITLATMTQIVLGGSTDRLPDTYNMTSALEDDAALTSYPDEVMANHLRAFLADPSFPAFVTQVDKQLQKILNEGQE